MFFGSRKLSAFSINIGAGAKEFQLFFGEQKSYI